jgi:hypothetical protein
MWKRKEGWEESHSWHAIYPVVSVGTKPHLIHIVEALHTRVLLLGHQVSPKSTTWPATKARHEGTRQAPLVTLMPPPLRSFSTEGTGSPRPPHKSVLTAPHQVGGSKMITDEPLRPQGFQHTLYNLIHSRITSQGRHNFHSLSSKLKLALSTHTKHVQWMNTWELVWLGYDLQIVLDSSALSHHPGPSNGWVEGV